MYSALFQEISVEIPSTLNDVTTDENVLFELVKSNDGGEMQEYFEIDKDLCTADTNVEIKLFI